MHRVRDTLEGPFVRPEGAPDSSHGWSPAHPDGTRGVRGNELIRPDGAAEPPSRDCADLRTVSLARLIELKLVTWRYKDWGDVVELIRRNQLPGSFAEKLDPIVRFAYAECWDQANDKEYEEPTG